MDPPCSRSLVSPSARLTTFELLLGGWPSVGYSEPVEFGVLHHFAYKVVDSDEELGISTFGWWCCLGLTSSLFSCGDHPSRDDAGRRCCGCPPRR